ncbi:hypothetical protein [Brevundimonas diminuta]|uniref:hypothetical protein n=1 Tax=Brevundimonas diminuta TaxID=293 RepID=UPI003D039070
MFPKNGLTAVGSLMIAAALAACSPAGDADAGKAAPTEALPAPAPAPVAEVVLTAPGDAAPPLSAYVGKHPTDPVRGVSFFRHPAVRAAVEASGVDRDIQKSIFFDGNVVGVVTPTRGRLLLHGYDPAGAGVTNWAILIVPDGSKAAVCHSDGVVKDKQGADWYLEGDLVFTLYQPCPSEEGDMESLSNWPIGPIPG